MKLTIKSVRSARYKGGVDIRWDSEVRGLGVRVYASGRKSYVLKYRTRTGRSRLLTIGPTDSMTLDQARKRAQRRKVEILDGGDPVAERVAERSALTCAEFFTKYVNDYSKVEKRSWREDKRRLDRAAKSIGQIKLAALTTDDLERLHTRIKKQGGPVEANRVVEVIRAAINKAKSPKWRDLPREHVNPASTVELDDEPGRERFLTREEMPRVLAAISRWDHVYVRSALMLILLTGLRKGEARSLAWDRVDLSNRLIHLPETKAGKGRTVPLTDAAVRLLESIPRERDNRFVFPGSRAGTRISAPFLDLAWRTIRKAAGVEDVTVHDLRRSTGSWLAMQGVGLPIIGSILGHASPTATAIYARLQPDAGREALERYGEMLTEMAEAEAGGKRSASGGKG